MYKNIIVYAKTGDPSYEFYIIQGKLDVNSYSTYNFKTLKVGDAYVSLAISKDAPTSDMKFIMNNFKALFESPE